MRKAIALVGAADTRGHEFTFLQSEILKGGCATLVVDRQ